MPQNVYQLILAWSLTQPLWQRDALRRIASGCALTDTDYGELTSLCLAGLNSTETNEPANPLNESHLRQPANAASVTLTRLRNVQNVGTLKEGESLEFKQTGLTVIFGNNGAGKSSYARIVKALCRTRGAASPILGNVFAKSERQSAATIDFQVGEAASSYNWSGKTNEVVPRDLAQIAIFDSFAADAYVAEKLGNIEGPQSIALQLLPRLAEIADIVKTRIQKKIETEAQGVRPVPGLLEGTKAATFFKGLSAETTDAELNEATLFDAKKEHKLKELQAQLHQLNADDPLKLAEPLRAQKRRFELLEKRVADLCKTLSPSALNDFDSLIQSQAARRSAFEVASALVACAVLPHVGDSVWRSLWEAARRYGSSSAYPGKAFPAVGAEDVCVLCQQKFDENSVHRMQSFEKFVQGEASSQLKIVEGRVNEACQQLERLELERPEDEGLFSELAALDQAVGTEAQRVFKVAQDIRNKLLDAAQAGVPLPTEGLSTTLVEQLRATGEQLEQRAQTLLANGQPEHRKKVSLELAELQARKMLFDQKQIISDNVSSLRRAASLKLRLKETNTNEITKTNTELTKRYQTKQLVRYFNEERDVLGLSLSSVSTGPAEAKKGELKHCLLLEGAIGEAKGKAQEILSDGEQRACALASFLAEVRASPSRSAILFDDPVSSLDQMRREKVAERLAKEGLNRQVIVFTHDVVFVVALKKYASDFKTPSSAIQIEKFGVSQAGHCNPDSPWAAKTVKERIGSLKNRLQELKAGRKTLSDSDYSSQVVAMYKSLRDTWERAVEEILFHDSIQRYRNSVETNKLRTVDAADIQAITEGMSNASRYLHDSPASENTPLPDPSTIQYDIARLESWAGNVKKRREDEDKERKAAKASLHRQ